MPVSKGAAGEKVLKAARLRKSAAVNKTDWLAARDLNNAEVEEGSVREPVPAVIAVTGVGGEIAPIGTDCVLAPYFRNTTEDPDYVAAGASRDRIELAHEANALEMALDIADTVGATNSVERMLAHQLGAAHHGTMKLLAQMNHLTGNIDRMQHGRDWADIDRKNIQATRLANAVARMMAACGQSALALQKLKAGPHQVMTVQHVTVEEGGQAVVAGQMNGGGPRKRGRGAKNEQ